MSWKINGWQSKFESNLDLGHQFVSFMESFRVILFGISGASIIFWVCVIALWHTYMFPRIFAEDNLTQKLQMTSERTKLKPNNNPDFISKGVSLRPFIKGSSFIDRGKYSRRSFVVADFSPIEKGYRTNGLYTGIILSIGVSSFLMICYAFRNILSLKGISL